MKMKRAKAHGAKNKNVLALYNKLTDLVDNLAELVDIQELTDTIILQVSTKLVHTKMIIRKNGRAENFTQNTFIFQYKFS